MDQDRPWGFCIKAANASEGHQFEIYVATRPSSISQISRLGSKKERIAEECRQQWRFSILPPWTLAAQEVRLVVLNDCRRLQELTRTDRPYRSRNHRLLSVSCFDTITSQRCSDPANSDFDSYFPSHGRTAIPHSANGRVASYSTVLFTRDPLSWIAWRVRRMWITRTIRDMTPPLASFLGARLSAGILAAARLSTSECLVGQRSLTFLQRNCGASFWPLCGCSPHFSGSSAGAMASLSPLAGTGLTYRLAGNAKLSPRCANSPPRLKLRAENSIFQSVCEHAALLWTTPRSELPRSPFNPRNLGAYPEVTHHSRHLHPPSPSAPSPRLLALYAHTYHPSSMTRPPHTHPCLVSHTLSSPTAPPLNQTCSPNHHPSTLSPHHLSYPCPLPPPSCNLPYPLSSRRFHPPSHRSPYTPHRPRPPLSTCPPPAYHIHCILPIPVSNAQHPSVHLPSPRTITSSPTMARWTLWISPLLFCRGWSCAGDLLRSRVCIYLLGHFSLSHARLRWTFSSTSYLAGPTAFAKPLSFHSFFNACSRSDRCSCSMVFQYVII